MIVQRIRYNEIPIVEIRQNGKLIWALYIIEIPVSGENVLTLCGRAMGDADLPESTLLFSPIKTQFHSRPSEEKTEEIFAISSEELSVTVDRIVEEISRVLMVTSLGATVSGNAVSETQTTEIVIMQSEDNQPYGLNAGAILNDIAQIQMTAGSGFHTVSGGITYGSNWSSGHFIIRFESMKAHGRNTDTVKSRGSAGASTSMVADHGTYELERVRFDALGSGYAYISDIDSKEPEDVVFLAHASDLSYAGAFYDAVNTSVMASLVRLLSTGEAYPCETVQILNTAKIDSMSHAGGYVRIAWLGPILTDGLLMIRQSQNVVKTDSTIFIA